MPKGAFYCIAELPVQDTEHFCRWLLEKFHLNNTTVMLAPAHGFYSQKNGIKNQVRIAYVLELKKGVFDSYKFSLKDKIIINK